jgi:hypothetical protein
MTFGQMSVSQMSVSQMSVRQMSVSQMSIGPKSVAKFLFIKCSPDVYWSNTCWPNVFRRKSTEPSNDSGHNGQW